MLGLGLTECCSLGWGPDKGHKQAQGKGRGAHRVRVPVRVQLRLVLQVLPEAPTGLNYDGGAYNLPFTLGQYAKEHPFRHLQHSMQHSCLS